MKLKDIIQNFRFKVLNLKKGDRVEVVAEAPAPYFEGFAPIGTRGTVVQTLRETDNGPWIKWDEEPNRAYTYCHWVFTDQLRKIERPRPKSIWSIEISNDFCAFHDDASNELVKEMSNRIAMDIDEQILNSMVKEKE